MIYTSALAAVVSALAAECIDSTSKQAWQKLYQSSGNAGDLATLARAAHSGEINRQDVDCWIYARLHSQLIPRHWNALVARYSTHRQNKRAAIEALIPLIASPAPRRFLGMAVYTWAIPKLRGMQGRRSTDMIVLEDWFYSMNNWESEGRPESTRREWRRNIQKVLDDMVKEAVREAEQILMAEGVLIEIAA